MRYGKTAALGCTLVVAAWAWVGGGSGEALAQPKKKSPTESVDRCPGGMVVVAGGQFLRGSNPVLASERPVQRVDVTTFCMDQTEVTVAAYSKCVERKSCESAPTTVDWDGIPADARKSHSSLCNGNRSDRHNHPVNCVTWDQAATFCNKVGKRLPDETEWEYAARGRGGRNYPWGNAEPDETMLNAWGTESLSASTAADLAKYSANVKGVVMYMASDGAIETAPVGNYPNGRSLSSIDDMAGNVREWTSSRYSQDYSKSPSDDRRVIRGSSMFDKLVILARASVRYYDNPSVRRVDVGFRCAKSLP